MVLIAFIEIMNESNHKPNKLWHDQGRKFCNKTYARIVRQ